MASTERQKQIPSSQKWKSTYLNSFGSFMQDTHHVTLSYLWLSVYFSVQKMDLQNESRTVSIESRVIFLHLALEPGTSCDMIWIICSQYGSLKVWCFHNMYSSILTDVMFNCLLKVIHFGGNSWGLQRWRVVYCVITMHCQLKLIWQLIHSFILFFGKFILKTKAENNRMRSITKRPMKESSIETFTRSRYICIWSWSS